MSGSRVREGKVRPKKEPMLVIEQEGAQVVIEETT